MPLASASLFDLGVFLTVVGATMMMLARAWSSAGSPLMEAWLALFIGVMAGCGVYLLLRARTFDVVLGHDAAVLRGQCLHLRDWAAWRSTVRRSSTATRAASLAQYADPLPQALVLTAIVISFAMTALLLVIALRARAETGSDHVDGDATMSPPADPGEGTR